MAAQPAASFPWINDLVDFHNSRCTEWAGINSPPLNQLRPFHISIFCLLQLIGVDHVDANLWVHESDFGSRPSNNRVCTQPITATKAEIGKPEGFAHNDSYARHLAMGECLLEHDRFGQNPVVLDLLADQKARYIL